MLSHEIAGEIEPGLVSAFANGRLNRSRISARVSRRLLVARAQPIAEGDLQESSLVFSPHPDDECLGCGGTLVRMKRAGAKVKLVHMTDGSGSHPELISPSTLRHIRREEARKAAAVLGVDDIFFLDFQDSKLWQQLSRATDRVHEILQSEQPKQVFVPYRFEPWRQAADHLATTQIVRAAIRRYAKPLVVWEYPVWFWLHWPWVGLEDGCPPIRTRHIAKNSVKLRFGLRAFEDLRYSVDISGVLERKLAALAEHRSQLSRLIPDKHWTTLGDVANGRFLDNFGIGHEFFHRSSLETATQK